MYSEFLAIEAMNIFWPFKGGASTDVRVCLGCDEVMMKVSRSRMKMNVMKRGLGRKKVRRKEREMIDTIVGTRREKLLAFDGRGSGVKAVQFVPCHVKLKPRQKKDLEGY